MCSTEDAKKPATRLNMRPYPATARLPFLSSDGSWIYFFSTKESPEELYTHGTCSRLCRISAAAAIAALNAEEGDETIAVEVEVIVETVEEVKDHGAFPGLWGGTGSPLKLFEPTPGTLLINSAAFGHEAVWAVRTGGTEALPVVPSKVLEGGVVVATTRPSETISLVAVTMQSPDMPPHMFVAPSMQLMAGGRSFTLPSAVVTKPIWPPVLPQRTVSWQSITIDPPDGRVFPSNIVGEVCQYHAIAPLAAPNDGPPPAVLFPHGGPHSVTCSTFSPIAVFFAKLGYTTLLVNYRGSLSFGAMMRKQEIDQVTASMHYGDHVVFVVAGQGSIRALRGRCGTLDVADCMAVLKDASRRGLADLKRTCFFGGSHR
eukprot:SAG31_NODE_5146_length_2715_cov_1.456040_2_plen_373_part_00